MPPVLDATPISQVAGEWAESLWHSDAPHVTVTEGESLYVIEPRELPWRLERGEVGWTASDLMTGIFGAGADANEAIGDLVRALREHREVLEAQDELSLDLQEQLHYLQQQ